MARAIDVLNYLRSDPRLDGDVKLMKLVYYAQAWSLVWGARPLFTDRVEAWTMGPVVRSVWPLDKSQQSPGVDLSDEERAMVDAVVQYYGGQSGTALADRTHREAPWRDAWGARTRDHRGSDEITRDAMRRFYTAEALCGRTPSRPSIGVTRIDDGQLDKIAGASVQRWSRTLAILAR